MKGLAALILRPALQYILPKAPAWSLEVIIELVPAVVDLVEEAIRERKMDPLDLVVRIRFILDDACDAIPGWSGIGEARRTVILDGLVELVRFIYEAAAKDDGRAKPAEVKKLARQMKRRLKREAA